MNFGLPLSHWNSEQPLLKVPSPKLVDLREKLSLINFLVMPLVHSTYLHLVLPRFVYFPLEKTIPICLTFEAFLDLIVRALSLLQ